MPRQNPGRSPKISIEERKLQELQAELQRREQELERRIQKLPAQIEAKKQKEKQLAKLRAHTASPAISLGGARAARATSSRAPRKRTRLPGQEIQYARYKFLLLVLILITMSFLLWHSISTMGVK